MEDEVVQSQVLVAIVGVIAAVGVFQDGQRHDRTDHDVGHVVCYFDCLYSRRGDIDSKREEGDVYVEEVKE